MHDFYPQEFTLGEKREETTLLLLYLWSRLLLPRISPSELETGTKQDVEEKQEKRKFCESIGRLYKDAEYCLPCFVFAIAF